MAFPWDPKVQIHTASARDCARAACKILAKPDCLENGDYIDIISECLTPAGMAEAVGKAMGEPITAYKGPWIFLWFGHYFGFEASSILTMGQFIEKNWNKDFIKRSDRLSEFLDEEIKEEPLETVEAFAERNFGQ